NIKGLKFSTSRGIALWVEDFLEKYPADSLRYSLAISMPETRDADFSWEDFQAKHNNELADILGNFVNRTFIFVRNYFGGKLPHLGELDDLDQQLIDRLVQGKEKVGRAIDEFQFKEATRQFMDVARFANKYFNDQEPWSTRKNNPEKCATTLNLCTQTAYSLAILMNPILPFTSAKIWKMLHLPDESDRANWEDIGTLPLEEGHSIEDIEILFQKIPEKVIKAEIENMRKLSEGGPEKAETKPAFLSFDEFRKMQLRTARVLSAEKVKGTDKLMKLRIEVGEEERQIIAGIAQHYSPKEMVGKTIIIVANLQPAKIRGIESNGMLLAVNDGDTLALVQPDRDVPSGKPVS
ncbi:MAG TPA: methionine--tRNA ligase subunit beta, partial [Caldithrix sp.]|nr:methionine--tRNA ligase subunit beta [Caldithrix sp.]